MCVASELQRYEDTIRCAAIGAEVPVHYQEKLTQTLIVFFLKTHVFVVCKLGGPRSSLPPSLMER